MNGLSESEREDLGMEALASMGDGRTTPLLSDDFLATVDRIADARVKTALEAAADQIDGWREMAIWAASHTEDPDQVQNSHIRALAYRRAALIVRAAIPQLSRRPADHPPPKR